MFKFNPVTGRLDMYSSGVPYTGATSNVDLNTKTLSVNIITPTTTLSVGEETSGKNVTIEATLGTEKCPALEAVNWTLGSGWSASGGVLTKASGVSSTAEPVTMPIVVGRTYKVVITVTAATGAYLYSYLGGVLGAKIDVGTHTRYITAATTAKLQFVDGSTGESATITYISVKEMTSGTGDLDIKGRLYARSPVSFQNPVMFNESRTANAPIEVVDNGVDGIRVTRNNVPGQYIQIGEGGGASHFIKGVGEKPFYITNAATTFGLHLGSNNTAHLNILANGNVGIGTTSPSNKLHIEGSSALRLTNSAVGIEFLQANATTWGMYNVSTNVNFSFVGQKVGIGTTTPSEKLDVNGIIKVAGYTVATLPAAGTVGRMTFVTDALAPTYLTAVIGGGTVVTPVFDNGVAWVAY